MSWTGIICGVTNPAKINGIAVADISKVNGVASSISYTIDYIANEVFSAYTNFFTGSDYIKNQVFS